MYLYERRVFIMKKYITPELSELFILEDVLNDDSDYDNLVTDPDQDGNYDAEDEWPTAEILD